MIAFLKRQSAFFNPSHSTSRPLSSHSLLSSHKSTSYLMLAIAYGVLLFTLTDELMAWVIVLGMCALVVRVLVFLRSSQLPHPRTINLLAVLSLFALTWFGFSIGLLNSMINLLAVAFALKLILLDSKRDFHLLFCTSLFLIGCGFISALSMVAWVGYLGVLIFLLLALAYYHGPVTPFSSSAKFVATLVVQSIPIAALLFLVMPQLPPLWQMPTSKSQQTGLSDTVTPGDIASLAKSSDLAFTATFQSNDDIPLPQQRYWRALVMEDFNGKTWSISDRRKQAERQLSLLQKTPPLTQLLTADTASTTAYEMIVEPTKQNWLFSLALSEPDNAKNTIFVNTQFDYTLRSSTPLMSKKSFYFTYVPSATVENAAGDFERQLNSLLPATTNEKTQAWALALKQQHTTPTELANAIMSYFRQQGFTYTLEPNAMPVDTIDTFLFEEKAGFCAHYASAMTFALRAAGVPARMVTGYQGGEQLDDNVLQVRQYDAHAWVEALIDNKWQRYDPTSMVAPSRLSFGLEQALADFGEKRTSGLLGDLSEGALFMTLQNWMRQMDYQWSKWILGFDANKQKDLLEDLLGQITTRKMTAVFLSSLSIVGVILLVYFFPIKRRPNLPKHQRIYRNALALVEKHTGVNRHHLSPQQYLEQVGSYLTHDTKASLHSMTALFNESVYSAESDNLDKSRLTSMMKQHFDTVKKSLRQQNA
ncbi:transglutaminase family protein [Alteromonas sp. P256]|uniref:transglutaminase family protein n=1 Tax=Alteromonas sp. P256 TaxID=3117399 RepID=UPI002FE3FC04